MHCSSNVSIFIIFYLMHMAALLTLILRSQYQGTIHWLAWGRWQKCLCFPSVCMREKGGRERTRCNKWRVRDDRACDPIFFPLRFLPGFCVRPLCDMCDMNLISLCLYCWLSVSDPLSSITGLLATVMKLLMSPVICLLVYSAIQIQGCNLKNQ